MSARTKLIEYYYWNRSLASSPLLTLGPPHYKFISVIEQRKNRRFELRLPFELVQDGLPEQTQGQTLNLSSSGVLFTATTPLQIGRSIEYQISLPKMPGSTVDVRLRCVGKVLRSEPESSFAATLERYEFIRG